MSFADRTAELWLEIDQLHLRYLQHEDTVAKVMNCIYFLKDIITLRSFSIRYIQL